MIGEAHSHQDARHGLCQISVIKIQVNKISKKSALYFDDEDLIDHDAIDKINHINQFKKDIPTIVTESTEDKVSLNQLNYYNTLRRISEKK